MLKEFNNETGFMSKPFGRLNFLKFTGAAVATTGLLMAGCKKDNDSTTTPPANDGVNLGSGDTGILNYAYALEQLEAAFYAKVMANPYAGITTAEMDILNDIKLHEQAHKDFFKAALGSNAIIDLTVNFSSIDFTSRTSVLNTAKAFEDLGVSAYNGAGQLIVNADYLLLAGKIVSVEARHAAAIRDLLNPGTSSFAGDDTIDATTGLDKQRSPSEVLSIASAYLTTKINASNLPK